MNSSLGAAGDMIGDMDDGLKMSRWAAAGAPTKCFLPLCRRPFQSSCIHGQDGRYYCSKECAAKGSTMDFKRVEELRPKRASAQAAVSISVKTR
jgi:hypothetical protein